MAGRPESLGKLAKDPANKRSHLKQVEVDEIRHLTYRPFSDLFIKESEKDTQ